MSGLTTFERAVMTGGGPLGIMQSVMDNVIPLSTTANSSGQSIEFQLIQGKVADMYTVLQAGRSFAHTGANPGHAGQTDIPAKSARLRQRDLWCAEKATWMAGEGVQIHGGKWLHQRVPPGPPLARC